MPPSVTTFSNPSICILQKKNVRSWGELDEAAQVRISALAPHLPCLQRTIWSNYNTCDISLELDGATQCARINCKKTATSPCTSLQNSTNASTAQSAAWSQSTIQFSALAGWVNPCSKVLRTLTSVNTPLTRCELLLTWLLFCQRILQRVSFAGWTNDLWGIKMRER
jgi:hypothetical protein